MIEISLTPEVAALAGALIGAFIAILVGYFTHRWSIQRDDRLEKRQAMKRVLKTINELQRTITPILGKTPTQMEKDNVIKLRDELQSFMRNEAFWIEKDKELTQNLNRLYSKYADWTHKIYATSPSQKMNIDWHEEDDVRQLREKVIDLLIENMG